MEHDWRKLVDGSDDDAEPDFESYLKQQEEKCKPISETKILNVGRLLPADSAEASVSSEVSYSEVAETDESSSTISVSNVDAKAIPTRATDEHQTKLDVRRHEIAGSYIQEEQVTIQHSDEWKEMFKRSYVIGVTELTPEKIIERFHELEHTVYLIRAQQGGLRLSLADLLKTKNAAERERLLELESTLKRQANRRASGKSTSKKAKSSASKAGKSKQTKLIDTFIDNLGFDKAATEAHLRKANLLDSSAQDYINSRFAKG